MVEQVSTLHNEIRSLKEEKNAVILAHNYQVPNVQDVADFVGDSLGLARKAAETDSDIIVFCGVHFMAETASIISPDKTVLIPSLEAGCSLSDTITAKDLREWKRRHPDAVSVGYVNTTADVKAELDYCCTSSNAVSVVNKIPKEREILFLPDMFLGSYVSKMTGRKNMYIWAGECHVHAGIPPDDVRQKLASLNSTEFIIHPECSCTTPIMHDAATGRFNDVNVHILSTEGMMRHVRSAKSKNYVIATETGILHRMKRQNPDKRFVAASDKAECEYMKMITLEGVRDSLLQNRFEVKVPKETADRARLAIERMLAIS